MHVYLVQHAEALPGEQDPMRPLSELGREHARRMGQYLSRHAGLDLADIQHSGKGRAVETASLLADALGVDCKVGHDLKPSDDPALWASRLTMCHQDLMLVGHLPHLQRLAGLLLCSNDALELLHFRNAGVLCLERNEDGAWLVAWMMTPQLLPQG